MDIGSSKPSENEMRIVKHHLINIVNPDNSFTAGDFSSRASIISIEIKNRGKVPLIVGGTGFYINSFFDGIDEIPDIDEIVKKTAAFEFDNGCSDLLYEELKKVDPQFAGKVHKNDRQRIIRGISVYRGTGKSLSSYYNKKEKNNKFDPLFIGLYIEKEILHRRIDLRVDSMIQNGLIEEVENLRLRGYSPLLNSMQSIGYSEINRYLDGIIPLDNAIDEIKKNTKKYAKKQMTWFKKNKSVIWFSPDEIIKIPDIVKDWLN